MTSQVEGEEDDFRKKGGIHKEGYGIEIVSYKHSQRTETEALVEMPKDTKYKVRLTNANDHMCMVKIEVDGIDIGKYHHADILLTIINNPYMSLCTF